MTVKMPKKPKLHSAVWNEKEENAKRVLQSVITGANFSNMKETGPYGQACILVRKKNTTRNRMYFYNVWRRKGTVHLSAERSKLQLAGTIYL